MPPKSDTPPMRELISEDQARGIELVLTPVVFGGFGWLLDSWLGTTPWLALVLGAVALFATVAKMWFAYDAEMRELESTSRWARRLDRPALPPADDVDLWSDRKAGA